MTSFNSLIVFVRLILYKEARSSKLKIGWVILRIQFTSKIEPSSKLGTCSVCYVLELIRTSFEPNYELNFFSRNFLQHYEKRN